MLSSCFGFINSFRGGYGAFGGGMFRDFNPMWMMGFGLIRLLILGLILFLIIRYLVPRLKRSEAPVQSQTNDSRIRASADSALAILNERYAKGELDADTYQTMKENLLRQ